MVGVLLQAGSAAASTKDVGSVHTYGAQSDAGQTDDPRIDAVRYRGPVYYVGCTRGDDTNDGLTPGTAWGSLAAVNERTEVGYWDLPTSKPRRRPENRPPRMSAPSGSAFLFERGCSFDGYINLHAILPGKGKPRFSDDITFGAYGERSKPRPRIEARSPGADFRATIWSNGHSVHLRNLHLVGSASAPKPGVWLRKSVGSSIENSVIEGMMGDGVHAGESHDLLIRNSVFRNNQLAGKPGGGVTGSGTNMRLLYNTFVNNGRHRVLAHNLYLSSLKDALIEGNHIEGGSNLGIVLHGASDGVRIIDNNIFDNSNGIDITGGYPHQVESFNKIVIERNRIHHNGLGPKQQGYGLLLKSLTNSVIRNNLIYANRVSPMAFFDKNKGDPGSANLEIEHNVFESPSLGLSFGGSEIANVVLRNNIIVVLGDHGFAIKKAAEVPDAALSLRSNLFFAPRLDERKLVSWGTQLLAPTALGASSHPESPAIIADPLFVNANSGDFRLQQRSIARSVGTASGVATDFSGRARRPSAPTIGAYE